MCSIISYVERNKASALLLKGIKNSSKEEKALCRDFLYPNIKGKLNLLVENCKN